MGEMFTPKPLSRAIVFALAAGGIPTIGLAQDEPETMQAIEVIGVTPTLGVGLPEDKIPYNVQSADDEDLDRTKSLDITDYMNRNFAGVIVNDAVNNPLQPDIQYRGFTASPLLGLPQGLAVYQNSVRVNEVFGDTINWDLIPESSIANMNLVGGANPLYGLNTLGGAIALETKNGFTHPGHSLEVYGGSYERYVTTVESGGNNGTWGYYTTFQYFDEEGWRDASPSDSLNLFTALSYRDGNTTSLDLNFNYADTDLIGNGAIPIELAQRDRSAIFTSPDQTKNEMFFLDLEGEHWLNDVTQISGNIFYRDNDTNAFNGDGSEYDECDSDPTVLCEEDEPTDPIEDQNGNEIAVDGGNGERNGLQNRSTRDQENYGFSLQTAFFNDLFNRDNQLIIGGGYNAGEVDFMASSEVARLTPQRSTIGSGLFVPEEGTFINSEVESWSLYVTDTLSLTEKLDLTLSARYNHTNVKLNDRGGTDAAGHTVAEPDLNGDHDFDRINPAIGLTYAIRDNLSTYASYSESSRAPTAVELACADEDAPCSLPNGFLADPPLEQVVAKSFEGGFRGSFRNIGMMDVLNWQVGAFHTTNEDDIIFQTTGGVSSNQGFFNNVGDTERVGMELGLNGVVERLNWFMNYSYVSATYEDPFSSNSANNPAADSNGKIQVQPGDHIPGIPEHTFKVGGDFAVTPKLSLGADLLYKSGVYLRGDESNQLGKLDDYVTVDLRGEYQINKMFSVFALVNNVFDEDYESFGLLGEPDEVPGFDNFEDARFVGVGAPRSAYIGARMQF
ncbi:outer membrane receptor protein involved in Fe transport [Methylohalomonas lacus]|uniref:Outer membrane receptor protein involved in Fe transport n=1 Tax=Methylohalomonas lacus TaxID=398773 RepID=A0AAE3L599_9GAMM|nr:TonB-dependent receptor [Methylohalomonas lacus]MCS3902967.1 outer membrane receptor protein involved in Fe transport [Methylohalomonas lacus]